MLSASRLIKIQNEIGHKGRSSVVTHCDAMKRNATHENRAWEVHAAGDNKA